MHNCYAKFYLPKVVLCSSIRSFLSSCLIAVIEITQAQTVRRVLYLSNIYRIVSMSYHRAKTVTKNTETLSLDDIKKLRNQDNIKCSILKIKINAKVYKEHL